MDISNKWMHFVWLVLVWLFATRVHFMWWRHDMDTLSTPLAFYGALRWRHMNIMYSLESPAIRLFVEQLMWTHIKVRITGPCEGNSPVNGEFPAQSASNAEKRLPFDDVIIGNPLVTSNYFHTKSQSCGTLMFSLMLHRKRLWTSKNVSTEHAELRVTDAHVK